MSAAASAPALGPALRVVTRGYAQIPNSLIENMVLFTHAELQFALAVLRRSADGTTVPLSNQNWVNWTGLSDRQKEYAITGLKRRNLLHIVGRGDKARFGWDMNGWRSYVAKTERALERPITVGRKKGVLPKPGALVHPDCREHGCDKLACQDGGLSLVPSGIAQPVARSPIPPKNYPIQINQQVKPPIAQPVAETYGTAKAWAETLAAIRKPFPLVGVAFLARLVSAVGSVFPDVTDAELGKAVEVSYLVKKKIQYAEGLFLLTVPETIAGLRELEPVGPAPGVADGMAASIARMRASLQAKGGDFLQHVAALDGMGNTWAEGSSIDLERIDLKIESLERSIMLTAERSLGVDQHIAVKQAVDAAIARIKTEARAVTESQLDTMRGTIRGREILLAAGLPRLGAFFE